MLWPVLTVSFFILIAGVVWLISRMVIAGESSRRLEEAARSEPSDDSRESIDDFVRKRPLRRYRFVPILITLLLIPIFRYAIGLSWMFTAAFATLTGLILWQVEATWAERKRRRMQEQLADAIDMMIASIKAGASLNAALESTLPHLRSPLDGEFDLLVGRIRLGDDPVDALLGMANRVPLEPFQLFSQAVAITWTTGGRLSQTLSNIARTIRDRIELTRRLNSMTMQARLSVVSVTVVTYFIAALMWRNDPERMGAFLNSLIGQSLTCAAIFLQGIGVLWISHLSKARI